MKKIIDKIKNFLKKRGSKDKNKIIEPTLHNINEKENKCYVEAQRKYPEYLKLSEDLILYSYSLLESHNKEFLVCSMLYAPLPKALTLAILSFIRQHTYQAHFNIRLAIEYLSLMLYAFDNPNLSSFGKFIENGNFKHDDEIFRKAGKALQEKYGQEIEKLKGLKDSINASHAHANVNNAKYNFNHKPEEQLIENHFFDQLQDEDTEIGLMGTNLFIINVFELLNTVSKNYDAIKLKSTFEKDILLFKNRFKELQDKLYNERKAYIEAKLKISKG